MRDEPTQDEGPRGSEPELAPLPRLFLERFQKAFEGYAYHLDLESSPEVRIPPLHEHDGEVRVWLDADEVTVGLGDFFHRHFGRYSYADPDLSIAEVETRSVAEALEFISEWLDDQIVLHVWYRGTEPKRASIQYEGDEAPAAYMITARSPDQADGAEVRHQKYRYSGPVPDARPDAT